MESTMTQMTVNSLPVETVLMWLLVIVLGVVFISLAVSYIMKLKGSNQVFYTQKGAINLRIEKLPDIRVATKNCKDFKLTAIANTVSISYANPFGGVKKFKFAIVGDPVKKPFELKFTEKDFKKLCFHLKPGNISITKTKITFNYNQSVKVRFRFLDPDKIPTK